MTELDGLGQAQMVRDRQVSASELLEAAVSRAEKAQKSINCFAALFPDLAREQIARGLSEGPYAGVPFVTKDLAVGVKGAPLTGGSRAYRDVVSTDDTTLVKRYREAGLVFFGSTT
ncbi:MAG: amidase, partial [Hyphomonas sp.]|uniref:amidase family protein n=1 Tax=Hyphomonas sp. TaxID=87 RepID=UPI0025B97C43